MDIWKRPLDNEHAQTTSCSSPLQRAPMSLFVLGHSLSCTKFLHVPCGGFHVSVLLAQRPGLLFEGTLHTLGRFCPQPDPTLQHPRHGHRSDPCPDVHKISDGIRPQQGCGHCWTTVASILLHAESTTLRVPARNIVIMLIVSPSSLDHLPNHSRCTAWLLLCLRSGVQDIVSTIATDRGGPGGKVSWTGVQRCQGVSSRTAARSAVFVFFVATRCTRYTC